MAFMCHKTQQRMISMRCPIGRQTLENGQLAPYTSSLTGGDCHERPKMVAPETCSGTALKLLIDERKLETPAQEQRHQEREV